MHTFIYKQLVLTFSWALERKMHVNIINATTFLNATATILLNNVHITYVYAGGGTLHLPLQLLQVLQQPTTTKEIQKRP